MAEENVVGKTNYWTQVAKEQAKALGYRSMKAHKCPNCKAFSLYKTRSMFMKVRYHCLNPYCKKSQNPFRGGAGSIVIGAFWRFV